jgi:hypothetical protein
MLDRHDGGWMGGDAGQLTLLAGDAEPTPGAPERRTAPSRTLCSCRCRCATRQAEGGGFEPR